MITSLTNHKVKEWTKLHLKKYRDHNYLITDETVIRAAEKAGVLKEVIYCGRNPYDVSLSYEVSKEVMSKIARQDDLSCVGVAEKDETIKKPLDRVAVLDNLKDPQNVGTIIKSAALFGFDTVILLNDCVDIYHPKCLKASEGAIYDLNIIHAKSLAILDELKGKGFKILATGLKRDTKELHELNCSHNFMIVLGNEGEGVSEEVYAKSDLIFKIPMQNMDSLNVAVAGGIIMYHFRCLNFNT